MPCVAEERFRVGGIRQVIAVPALHVNGRAAQISVLDQRAQSPRRMSELIVVTSGDSHAPGVRSRDELVVFCRAQREWLLYIDMSAVLETGLRDWEMTRGRGRHVDHVRPRVLQEIGEV